MELKEGLEFYRKCLEHCDMVIANGNDFHNIGRICDGEKVGTLFLADRKDEFYVLNKLEHMV